MNQLHPFRTLTACSLRITTGLNSALFLYLPFITFDHFVTLLNPPGSRLRLKCDGTRAETRFIFMRNGRVHLNRRGRQFCRLLAAEMCALAVVMLDTACSEVVWRVLATHSIRQFPLHFPSRASPCAITFQLDCTTTVLFLSPKFLIYPSVLIHYLVQPTLSRRATPLSVPWESMKVLWSVTEIESLSSTVYPWRVKAYIISV